jgi:5-methylcytosine-specific restriction endonuclease McrA
VVREVKNAGWERTGAWWWTRYVFVAGKVRHERGVRPAEYARMARAQAGGAVAVMCDGPRTWWWCGDRFFWEDGGLAARDVHALVYERRRRAERRLERAHAVLAQAAVAAPRRDPIPGEVKRAVWERDGGACVACGAAFDLQYDHVIPFSLGGASTVENLQILCAGCNRAKGAAL